MPPGSSLVPLLLLLLGDARAQQASHHYVYFKGTGKSWANANADCITRGGFLATITSDVDNQEALGVISSGGGNLGWATWIGLGDGANEGTFVWASGSTSPYRQWAPGEPNNNGGGEDCVGLKPDGKWNDGTCPDTLGYLCELPVTPPSPPAAPPATGFTFIRVAKTWSAARADCQTRGGDLATITSDAENEEAKALIAANGGTLNAVTWIGLTDAAAEGTFIWIDGNPSTYRHWNPGEPNDHGSGEDCVGMYANGKWNDEPCGATEGYLCAIPPLALAPPVAPPPPPPFPPAPPPMWFDFVRVKVSWSAARADCQTRGGDLASITSDAENAAAVALIAAGGGTSGSITWMGLNDVAVEGTFGWVNGETSTYRNWNPGEPNDYGGSGEDCVGIYPNGKWNDENCNNQEGYLCAIPLLALPPPVPPPPSAPTPTFVYMATPRSWMGARADCLSQGGDLATIASAEEMLAASLAVAVTNQAYWIGLTDSVVEGSFVWIDGSTALYRNFAPGEPNNYGGGEDCVAVKANAGGKWNDRTCTNQIGYLCGFPAPAPPPCVTHFVVPHANAVSQGVSEYVKLPLIHGIWAISLWVYIETSQDTYGWDYVLDARPGLPYGWLSYDPYPSLIAGSSWKQMIIHDSSSGGKVSRVASGTSSFSSVNVPGGKWHHLYIESKTAFSTALHVLSRYQSAGVDGMEDGDGRFASASLWGRPLNASEVDDLAIGGVGPSMTDPAALIASYYVDQATYSSTTTPKQLPDATGRHPNADVVTNYAVDMTLFAFQLPGADFPGGFPGGLPQCIPQLQGLPPPPPMSPPAPAPGALTYIAQGKTWPLARADCQAQGGDLASIYDATDNALAVAAKAAAGSAAVWIGLTDQLAEGTFLWSDGSSSPYRNWNAGEPNDYGSAGEDCAAMQASGVWNDRNCGNVLGYLFMSSNSAADFTNATRDALATAFANVAMTDASNVFVSVVPDAGGFGGAGAQGEAPNRISASIAVESGAAATGALLALQTTLKDASSAAMFLTGAAGFSVTVVAIGDKPESTDGVDLSDGISGLGLSVLNDRRSKASRGGGGGGTTAAVVVIAIALLAAAIPAVAMWRRHRRQKSLRRARTSVVGPYSATTLALTGPELLGTAPIMSSTLASPPPERTPSGRTSAALERARKSNSAKRKLKSGIKDSSLGETMLGLGGGAGSPGKSDGTCV